MALLFQRSLKLGFFLVLALLTFLLSYKLVNSLQYMSDNIGQPNMAFDYLFGGVWAVFLGSTIILWPAKAHDKQALLLAWFIKCCVSMGLLLIYESMYSYMDPYTYYHAPLNMSVYHTMFEPVFHMGDGTQNISLVVYYLDKVLPDSFRALTVTFSMVGLIAVYIFYRAAVIYTGKENLKVFFALLLCPSLLFWSSVLGKDPVTVLAFALYAYGVVGYYKRRQKKFLLALMAGIVVGAAIRSWLAPIMLFPVMLTIFLNIKGIASRLLILVVFAGVMAANYNAITAQFKISSSQELLEKLDSSARAWGDDGNASQEVPFDLTDPKNVVLFMPLGAFTALLRPLPGEVRNAFGTLAGLENFALLWLCILAFKRTKFREIRQEPIVQWGILLIAAWAALYGFISYQNLGAAVRYRIQILPFFLILLLYLGRKRSQLQ